MLNHEGGGHGSPLIGRKVRHKCGWPEDPSRGWCPKQDSLAGDLALYPVGLRRLQAACVSIRLNRKDARAMLENRPRRDEDRVSASALPCLPGGWNQDDRVEGLCSNFPAVLAARLTPPTKRAFAGSAAPPVRARHGHFHHQQGLGRRGEGEEVNCPVCLPTDTLRPCFSAL